MTRRPHPSPSLNVRLLEHAAEPVILPAGWTEVLKTPLIGRGDEIADIDGSHVLFIAQPDAATDVIMTAITAVS